jgi:hypothetical protein
MGFDPAQISAEQVDGQVGQLDEEQDGDGDQQPGQQDRDPVMVAVNGSVRPGR